MRILLIGCGNIGNALLKTWKNIEEIKEVAVVDPNVVNSDLPNITFFKDIDALQDFSEDIIVLAVKPQMLNQVLNVIRNRNSNALVVSTLAGITTKILAQGLKNHKNIIRIMPNMAIKTGHSVNLAFVPCGVSAESLELFKNVFIKSGKIFFLNQEDQIDILTPIFGCGPAYFFLLADIMLEYLSKNAISNAKEMMDELLIGVSSLAQNDVQYKDIIKSVSSKQGVTEAALKAIGSDMHELIEKSFKAALTRIQELSNENCC